LDYNGFYYDGGYVLKEDSKMQIKMDTDQVRAMATRLRQTADLMDTHLASIKQSVTSAGWQSQAREEFIIQLETLKRSTDQSTHVLRLMAQAAEEKATQWEAIANVSMVPSILLKVFGTLYGISSQASEVPFKMPLITQNCPHSRILFFPAFQVL
jgi:hypothetical protein